MHNYNDNISKSGSSSSTTGSSSNQVERNHPNDRTLLSSSPRVLLTESFPSSSVPSIQHQPQHKHQRSNQPYTVQDIVQIHPMESEAETMVLRTVLQDQNVDTSRHHHHHRYNNNNNIFDSIPDTSMYLFIGGNTDKHRSSNLDNNNATTQLETTKSTTVQQVHSFDKPQQLRQVSSKDNSHNNYSIPHNTSAIIPPTVRRAQTNGTSTVLKHDTSTPNDGVSVRSNYIPNNNMISQRHLQQYNQLNYQDHHHRRSESVSSSSFAKNTLASMAQQLDQFQNLATTYNSNSLSYNNDATTTNRFDKKSISHRSDYHTDNTVLGPYAIGLLPPKQNQNIIFRGRIKSEGHHHQQKQEKQQNHPISSTLSLSTDHQYTLNQNNSWNIDDDYDTLDDTKYKASIIMGGNENVHSKTISPTRPHVIDEIHFLPSDTFATSQQNMVAVIENKIYETSNDHEDIECGQSYQQKQTSSSGLIIDPNHHHHHHYQQKQVRHLRDQFIVSMRKVSSKICDLCRTIQHQCKNHSMMTNNMNGITTIWYDFKMFIHQRQNALFVYVRYLLFIVIPTIVIAFILFYLLGTLCNNICFFSFHFDISQSE
jgi:hypothetical protein